MDKKARAQNADRLLNDDTLLEAFSVVKQRCVGVFEYHSSTPDEILEAHRDLRALDALKSALSDFVIDGKVAEKREKKGLAP